MENSWVRPEEAMRLTEEIIDVAGKMPLRDDQLMILAHTLPQAIALLRAWVAGCGDEAFSSKDQCRELRERSAAFLQGSNREAQVSGFEPEYAGSNPASPAKSYRYGDIYAAAAKYAGIEDPFFRPFDCHYDGIWPNCDKDTCKREKQCARRTMGPK